MMPLHYTLSDAHGWAGFSGDYNPVHFDASWAKKQGAAHLSVHGMRALLDVKAAITPSASDAPLLKCTVRLRRPLWCDMPYQLIRDEKKAAAAIVRDPASGETCLTCQIAPTAALPDVDSVNVSRGELDRPTLTRLQQKFASLLPAGQRWHFLDALLFRHLIQDEALLRQEAVAAMLPQGTTLEALFAHIPVIQTHQESLFDHRLLADWHPHDPAENLTLETLPVMVIGDLQQGAIIRIAARTHSRNHFISTAVTLKIGPVAIA
ncbi:protein dehydratase [Erwinia aphidicola]|uniref:protein dehydratase n=1 Tax=Erwinia aphidicola TaxID=68334 RepID=UPI003016B2FE